MGVDFLSRSAGAPLPHLQQVFFVKFSNCPFFYPDRVFLGSCFFFGRGVLLFFWLFFSALRKENAYGGFRMFSWAFLFLLWGFSIGSKFTRFTQQEGFEKAF